MAKTQTEIVRFDEQGRAIVPLKLMENLGVKKGDEIIAWVEDGQLVLEPKATLIAKMRAKYAVEDGESSLVAELIAMRRTEAKKEKAELE